MSANAPRRLPLFARTFMLLLAALVVAYAIGMAVLLYRPPSTGTTLPEVAALLSSRMPSTSPDLKLHDADAEPQAPGGRYRDVPPMRFALAQWLGTSPENVRFWRVVPPAAFGRGEPPHPDLLPGPPPDEGRMGGPMPRPMPSPDGMRMPPDPGWRPEGPLRGDFIAAYRSGDGWRVVESNREWWGLVKRVAVLFLAGVLALLPLAWWFSRALASPIRRFAQAADRIGDDAAAPALPLDGPSEIARAAASFNAMQARLHRLLHERSLMAGAIAHDLRTPLTRLAFRLDALPEPVRHQAQADIDEMSEMIEATLGFVRDQHRAHVREPLDLRLLVESVVDQLRDTGHDVSLEPGAPAPLRGDPQALRRMAANLVGNALKYGHRARLRLHAHGDGYRLEIDDDGPGIDPAQVESLFLPFVRGEASRNRSTGGIGLGLASVRASVLAHHGRVELANRDGGGLRATVDLPRQAD